MTELKTKVCKKCGKEKPLTDFAPKRTQCIECRNEYKKSLYRRNKLKTPKAVGTRFCPDCKEFRGINDFFVARGAADGRAPYCKKHTRLRAAKWRQTESGKQAVIKNHRNNYYTEKAIKRRERLKVSEEAKEQEREIAKRYRERHPERVKALGAVKVAIDQGILPPAKIVFCKGFHGKYTFADHYHHFVSYDKEHWLVVIPLCKACHWLTLRKNMNNGVGTVFTLEAAYGFLKQYKRERQQKQSEPSALALFCYYF